MYWTCATRRTKARTINKYNGQKLRIIYCDTTNGTKQTNNVIFGKS